MAFGLLEHLSFNSLKSHLAQTDFLREICKNNSTSSFLRCQPFRNEDVNFGMLLERIIQLQLYIN